MKKIAKFWEKLPNGRVQCFLCPWKCVIASGRLGVCRSRKNEDGKLQTLVYGSIVSMATDPIEKKPLYHFWPGTDAFSIAAPGCNLKCLHCQNWAISQVNVEEIPHENVAPERIIELAKRYNCQGIAHTYSEPTIWTEYMMDVGKLAHQEGLYNVYVTNGYTSLRALEEIGPYLNASNVDVKAFTDSFYQKICGVRSIRPTLETCEWLVEHGKHLEVTYLIIPRKNDSSDEIRNFTRWVVNELNTEVPVHFSRFYPQYKMGDRGATPVETLERAVGIAKGEGVRYVYIGNATGHKGDSTYCHSCGELLIERYGFEISQYTLKDNKCPKCATKINIVGKYVSKK